MTVSLIYRLSKKNKKYLKQLRGTFLLLIVAAPVANSGMTTIKTLTWLACAEESYF